MVAGFKDYCRDGMIFLGGMKVYFMPVRIFEWSQKHRKGSITLEHVVLFPVFIFLSLIVWQLILSGIAVMDTHAALRDAVRVASTTGDTDKAEKQGKDSFGQSGSYKLKRLDVKIENDEAIAKAKVEIPILFMSSTPITYETEEKAPVLQSPDNFYGGFLGNGQLGFPVANMIITSHFGYRKHPILGTRRLHAGIDLHGRFGDPIFAAGDGVVVYAGPSSGYGNIIVIHHGGGLYTVYAHMYANQIKVLPGQQVKRGQKIAEIGNAGGSTGPHLHFEVRRGGYPRGPSKGVPVDPLPYLQG